MNERNNAFFIIQTENGIDSNVRMILLVNELVDYEYLIHNLSLSIHN